MSKPPIPELGGLIVAKGSSLGLVSSGVEEQPKAAGQPLRLFDAAPPLPAAPPPRVATVAVTVRLDEVRYRRLKDIAHRTGRSNKDLLIEGFDRTFGHEK